jgi:hypothetical protein
MDAGSIFLICFVVVFGSLLICGWRFGHPLLMCYARRRTPRRPPQQSPQTESGRAQDGEEPPRTRGKVRSHSLLSWRYLTRHQSATSLSGDQPNHSPRASPGGSVLSTFSQMISSCSIHKATGLDIVKEPHDLYNMVAVPPVPKQSLSRRVTDIGTQVSLLPPIIWRMKMLLALATSF